MTDPSSLTVPELVEPIEKELEIGPRTGLIRGIALESAQERLAELARRADCGGTNCGKCQQCLTVDKHFALEAVEHLKARAEALAEALEPFAATHRYRMAKGMKTKPPALGPKELQAAEVALARYRGEK